MVSIWSLRSLRSLRKWRSRGPESDTPFAPFVKFNMAAVNRRFLLEGWFFILGAFQRKRRRERQRIHRLWVREIFQKREFRYFAVGNAVHPGIVAVATIAVIELKSISVIVVTAIATIGVIAGEWFPYDRYNRWTVFFFSDRSDHMETSLISAIVAIAAIIWKPLSSDRSDHSNHSDSNNTRMHCVPDGEIPKFPLLEDLSNPTFMGSLSFPSSFTLKSTHKYKKTAFKQESMIHSRHVEFGEWREQCVRRRSPRPWFAFSAIVAIIWKS